MDAEVVIIGAGPAGLQAAIHSARKKASTVLVGKVRNSATYGIELENYLGTDGVRSGTDLLNGGVEQVRSFGGTVMDLNVLSLSRDGDRFVVHLENGESISARSLVLATGISRKKLGVPGETAFANGKGVSYCAVCDCNFYKGKTVALVGGESEAAVSAEFMTRYASKVYWISSEFSADAKLVDAAKASGVETVAAGIVSIDGKDRVESVTLTDGRIIPLDGVFIELGGKSSVDLAMDIDLMPELDDTIMVDRRCATSVPGVFACGDITGRPWQVAKAVGEGAVAGLSAADYAKKVA